MTSSRPSEYRVQSSASYKKFPSPFMVTATPKSDSFLTVDSAGVCNINTQHYVLYLQVFILHCLVIDNQIKGDRLVSIHLLATVIVWLQYSL